MIRPRFLNGAKIADLVPITKLISPFLILLQVSNFSPTDSDECRKQDDSQCDTISPQAGSPAKAVESGEDDNRHCKSVDLIQDQRNGK